MSYWGLLSILLFSFSASAKSVGGCREHDRFRAVYCIDLAQSKIGLQNPALASRAKKCAADSTCWCRVAVIGQNGAPLFAGIDPPNAEIAFKAGGPLFKPNPAAGASASTPNQKGTVPTTTLPQHLSANKNHPANNRTPAAVHSNVRQTPQTKAPPQNASTNFPDDFKYLRTDYIADPTFIQVAKYPIDKNRDCTLARYKKGECTLDILSIEKSGRNFPIASVCDLNGQHYTEDFYTAGAMQPVKVTTQGRAPSQAIAHKPPRSAPKAVYGGFFGLYGSASLGSATIAGMFLVASLNNGESALMVSGGAGALLGASTGSACGGVIGGVIAGPGCRSINDLSGSGIGACFGAEVSAGLGASAGGCISVGLKDAAIFKRESTLKVADAVKTYMSGKPSSDPAVNKLALNINSCYAAGAFAEVCAGSSVSVGAVGYGVTNILKTFRKGSFEDYGYRMMLGLPLH